MSPSGQPPDSSRCLIIENIRDFEQLQTDWTRLWAGTGLSFFSSWEWSWVWWQVYSEYLPKSARLKIFVFRAYPQGDVLAIFPTYEVNGPFGLYKRLSLLGIGEPVRATIYTELLDLICATLTPEVCAWATNIIKTYDQISLGIVRTDSAVLSVLNSAGLKGFNIKMVTLPNYRANLSKGFNHYLSQLSPNTRSQARKILKQLDEHSIKLSTPDTAEERTLWFNHLMTLHQKQWKERGKGGAFKDQRIIRFHTLILSLAPQAQVYRLEHSGTAIGYLYGFLTPERFDWYQMGIDFSVPILTRPGYGLHLATIRSLSATNATRHYEFLPGHNQLKKQLGPLKENAVYLEVCKSTPKYRLLSALSAIFHRWRKIPPAPV